jgi:hypothetical protein
MTFKIVKGRHVPHYCTKCSREAVTNSRIRNHGKKIKKEVLKCIICDSEIKEGQLCDRCKFISSTDISILEKILVLIRNKENQNG